MIGKIKNAFRSSEGTSLAGTFSRLGRIGFWMQLVIGAIPIALMIYTFVSARASTGRTRGDHTVVEYLTVVSLLVLAFTTLWFFRYMRLAKQIASPDQRPPEAAVQRVAWTGVAASTLGVLLSLLIMLFEVTLLLIYFLRAPQAGVPVVQTTGGAATWVSAADIVSLLVLIITMSVEIIVLAFSLWLLYRTMAGSVEYPRTAD